MKAAVVGGGPGGLYFARLLKLARPGARVRVFEQNAAGATFGFGVTLGGGSLGKLAQADPDLIARLRAQMLFDTVQTVRLNDVEVEIEYAQAGGSIARLKLLSTLREACLEAGVELEDRRRVDDERDLGDYDLVVAADGVGSAIRERRQAAFGTHTRWLTNRFAWFGVARALSPNALVFREALGGRFVAHYYAYAPDMSTFVAECDDLTWRTAGLDRMDDAERRRIFEGVFAPELDGAPLVENRSIWRQFPVITNDQWHDGCVVLIGDALRSAHFSIGSGTRLAMEDAQALVEALRDAPDVGAALPLFVERRRLTRDRFGEAAARSFDWYERLTETMRQEPLAFAHDFLTRTGRVDDARLESYAPAFARRWRDRAARVALAS